MKNISACLFVIFTSFVASALNQIDRDLIDAAGRFDLVSLMASMGNGANIDALGPHGSALRVGIQALRDGGHEHDATPFYVLAYLLDRRPDVSDAVQNGFAVEILVQVLLFHEQMGSRYAEHYRNLLGRISRVRRLSVGG